MNIKFLFSSRWTFVGVGAVSLFMVIYHTLAFSAQLIYEPIQACVIARDVDLTNAIRAQIADCLGWDSDQASPLCRGAYQPLVVTPLSNGDEVRIVADKVSFYNNQRSSLSGHLEVQQAQRVVNAQTAYVYRDAASNQVTKIEFLGAVRYLEPDMLMIASKASINPVDKSGHTEDVLYRFNVDKSGASNPVWGRAALIRRLADTNYFLRQATYTSCAPQDKAWSIEAGSIFLDNVHGKGTAKNAVLRLHDIPILYTPYLSFPTNKERKSGFLMPIVGYTNVGGFDFGVPYYLNLAPNYDLTLIPHTYAKRGVMLGGEYRYLSSRSTGLFQGDFLPNDRAYGHFLQNNEFPILRGQSNNRWSLGILDTVNLSPNLQFNLTLQRISDNYYFQDFSTNLSVATQRQLLTQGDLTYTTEHWTLRGMGQSYQTLQPINEPFISPIYERLPQLMATGFYYDLPFNTTLNFIGQYDQFHWPDNQWNDLNFWKDSSLWHHSDLLQSAYLWRSPELTQLWRPQGPRVHLNPILSLPRIKPWGYLTPSVQLVENYYQVNNTWLTQSLNFNRTIPRASVDTGLYFERNFGTQYVQTLEPRLFYLRVPYQNQTPIPVYDSGYMIFNVDQLFRTNRFSGFDRIGDANQLSYALITRWLSESTGDEIAQLSLGQIKYFSDRKVQLCQSLTGYCVDDPRLFGYLSPNSSTSPIASRAAYHINSRWALTADYIWDPATRATNNGDLNVVYNPAQNTIFSLGYSYLVNGDLAVVRGVGFDNSALNQATVAFSVPLSQQWSSVGAYSQNISKQYNMMSLLGVQYDSCCWAMRILGGRTFKNLNVAFEPQYNNNIYFQVLLKGLGSVANNDPNELLSTYIPGYNDPFRR